MRAYGDLFTMVERVVHKYSQREKKRKLYGDGIPLTKTEIRVLAAIGEAPGIGVTELAKQKGVTNGAISQMLKKLVEKGLVERQISPRSNAMVELYLAEAGRECFQEYKADRLEEEARWSVLLDILDEGNFQALKDVLVGMDQLLD